MYHCDKSMISFDVIIYLQLGKFFLNLFVTNLNARKPCFISSQKVLESSANNFEITVLNHIPTEPFVDLPRVENYPIYRHYSENVRSCLNQINEMVHSLKGNFLINAAL